MEWDGLLKSSGEGILGLQIKEISLGMITGIHTKIQGCLSTSPKGCGAAEATGHGLVCFVVINPCVLSVNRIIFLFHKLSNFTLSALIWAFSFHIILLTSPP